VPPSRGVAAIEDISELNEVRRTAGPVRAGVEHPGDLEDLDEPVVRAVDVADRDHALDAGPLAGARSRNGARGECDDDRGQTCREAANDGVPGHKYRRSNVVSGSRSWKKSLRM
jgi:hypothetical protein